MNKKEVIQSLSLYKSHIISFVKKFNNYKKSKFIIAAGLCFIVLVCVVINVSSTKVYQLTISGKCAGYITDKSIVNKAVEDILANYSAEKNGLDVSIDKKEITFTRTALKENDITALTKKDLEKLLIDSDICTAKGWTINVNGKELVALDSKKAANKVLSDIKGQYLTKGSKVLSTSFKEDVAVTQSAVQIGNFAKPEEAKALILTGEKAPEIYTVRDGDTLWDIASENGMSIAELESANPEFDPNKLKIGQQLNLVKIEPFITVETKELITATEKINFNTVYEETNTLQKGEIKIKTAGVCGSQQVSSEVTKENGIIHESKVIQTVVTAQPQTQVALKGTKPGTTYIASRGGGRLFSISASGSDIVAYAKKFLGTPYRHGGSNPDGFDCSGFTQYVYKHFGGNLPRTAAGQYTCGDFVEKSDLKPGDLVFFKSSSRISHVGIYVGGGSFIHAAQARDDVKISSFSSSTLKYCGAVRASD